MTTAYIALGSNLGDPLTILNAALTCLGRTSTRPIRVSRFYLTEPVDCPLGSPSFVNAVAEITVRQGTTPEELLALLKDLEISFGRQPKTIMNEARILDLDLISFGSEVRDTKELILPHPRAYQRSFVLGPLVELNPELILMGQTLSVAHLWDKLPNRGSIKAIG